MCILHQEKLVLPDICHWLKSQYERVIARLTREARRASAARERTERIRSVARSAIVAARRRVQAIEAQRAHDKALAQRKLDEVVDVLRSVEAERADAETRAHDAAQQVCKSMCYLKCVCVYFCNWNSMFPVISLSYPI